MRTGLIVNGVVAALVLLPVAMAQEPNGRVQILVPVAVPDDEAEMAPLPEIRRPETGDFTLPYVCCSDCGDDVRPAAEINPGPGAPCPGAARPAAPVRAPVLAPAVIDKPGNRQPVLPH